jgi:hypothetical protein
MDADCAHLKTNALEMLEDHPFRNPILKVKMSKNRPQEKIFLIKKSALMKGMSSTIYSIGMFVSGRF